LTKSVESFRIYREIKYLTFDFDLEKMFIGKIFHNERARSYGKIFFVFLFTSLVEICANHLREKRILPYDEEQQQQDN